MKKYAPQLCNVTLWWVQNSQQQQPENWHQQLQYQMLSCSTHPPQLMNSVKQVLNNVKHRMCVTLQPQHSNAIPVRTAPHNPSLLADNAVSYFNIILTMSGHVLGVPTHGSHHRSSSSVAKTTTDSTSLLIFINNGFDHVYHCLCMNVCMYVSMYMYIYTVSPKKHPRHF